jgi:hypothetical protein
MRAVPSDSRWPLVRYTFCGDLSHRSLLAECVQNERRFIMQSENRRGVDLGGVMLSGAGAGFVSGKGKRD